MISNPALKSCTLFVDGDRVSQDRVRMGLEPSLAHPRLIPPTPLSEGGSSFYPPPFLRAAIRGRTGGVLYRPTLIDGEILPRQDGECKGSSTVHSWPSARSGAEQACT